MLSDCVCLMKYTITHQKTDILSPLSAITFFFFSRGGGGEEKMNLTTKNVFGLY